MGLEPVSQRSGRVHYSHHQKVCVCVCVFAPARARACVWHDWTLGSGTTWGTQWGLVPRTPALSTLFLGLGVKKKRFGGCKDF